MAKYNELGQEIPDPTPVAMPVGYEFPESLDSIVSRMVRGRIERVAQSEGFESEVEANDFDVQNEDEGLELSKYQYQAMEEEYVGRSKAKEAKHARQKGSGNADKKLAPGTTESVQGNRSAAVGGSETASRPEGADVK